MNSREEHRPLRHLFTRNAPGVSEEELLPALRLRLASEPMQSGLRGNRFRMLTAVATGLVIIALMAVGAYEAAIHLGQEAPVVVITDDSMNPGSASSGERRSDSGSTGEVDVTVPVSGDVLHIEFLDLWAQLTATAGIDANEARLDNFRVFFNYPSGSLVRFDLQALTQNGYSLRVSHSGSSESLRMYGTRLPEFTPYVPPSFPTVGALLSALDLVGMESLLARLDISKSPQTRVDIGDDVNGVEMFLADKSDQGSAELGGQVRAYYYEAGGWVWLSPNDVRRTAGKTDIVLVLCKARDGVVGVSASDCTSFIIPAEAVGMAITAISSTVEQDLIQSVASEKARALADQILALVKVQLAELGRFAVQSCGIMPDSRQSLLEIVLADPTEPRAMVNVIIQKNVPESAITSLPDAETIEVAGSVLACVRDNSPENAQVVVMLPNQTTVNIAAIGVHANQATSIPMPISIEGLKKLAEAVADQFGAADF